MEGKRKKETPSPNQGVKGLVEEELQSPKPQCISLPVWGRKRRLFQKTMQANGKSAWAGSCHQSLGDSGNAELALQLVGSYFLNKLGVVERRVFHSFPKFRDNRSHLYTITALYLLFLCSY